MPPAGRISNVYNYATAIGVQQVSQRAVVDRSALKERLVDLICRRDGLLIVSGYSSIGKTSLINLATAPVELRKVNAPFRAVVPVLARGQGEGGVLKGIYDEISAKISGRRPDTLTPAYLADAIHRSQLLLIVDGVNSLFGDPGATKDLFNLCKVWTDLQRSESVQSKIILVASGMSSATDRWLSQASSGLRLPREHVDILPWDEKELSEIIRVGGQRLQVDYAPELRRWFVKVACGLPATLTLLAALSTLHANNGRDDVMPGSRLTVELPDLRGILGNYSQFQGTLYYDESIDALDVPALLALYILGLNGGLMRESDLYDYMEICGWPSRDVSQDLEHLVDWRSINEEMHWNIRELSFGTFAFLRLYHRSKLGRHDADQIATALGRLVETDAAGQSEAQTPDRQSSLPQDASIRSILFLAADPTDESRVWLGKEFREIDKQLRLAAQRRLKLELPQLALRAEDISGALLDARPQIVHFSGHGSAEGALCFEDETGRSHQVQPGALETLFKQFIGQVECVVLNACYSEVQARGVAKHIDYVIGMDGAIGNKAAIAFSVGFYQALARGETIEHAYEFGCVQIRLKASDAVPEHMIPVLLKKGG